MRALLKYLVGLMGFESGKLANISKSSPSCLRNSIICFHAFNSGEPSFERVLGLLNGTLNPIFFATFISFSESVDKKILSI